MNSSLIGQTLSEAQAPTQARIVETAPPVRPAFDKSKFDKPARRKKRADSESEVKAPRVQSWGETRVLRLREIAENDETVVEMTVAREVAVSASFASALLNDKVSV